MSIITSAVSKQLLNWPTEHIRLETGLGGYRIVAHDGRVLGTGSDVCFANETVREHNEQVDKNRMTGAAHL